MSKIVKMPAIATTLDICQAEEWCEVTTANPCPLCGKPDWCYVTNHGNTVQCHRIDPMSVPSGWKHIKNGKGGNPILARDNGDVSETDPNLIDGESFELNCYRTIFAKNWIVIGNSFYRYNSTVGYWEAIEDGTVRNLISEKAALAYESGKKGNNQKFFTASKIESAFKAICAKLTASEPPYNNHLIPFLNGTVDVRTGDLQPHSPQNFLTWGIALEYRPGVAMPKVFQGFVEQSFGTELIPLIRALTSMIIDPTAPYGYFPHVIGASGSGKGTLLRLWADMFATDSAKAVGSFSDLSTAEDRHQVLTGCRFVYIPDTGGYQAGMRAFYELVDNGNMSGRALFSSSTYNKQWNNRFAVASVNHLQIENAGDGWDRRCIPLPTKKRSGNPDPNLRQKLAECRADIISWALAMPCEERDDILDNARDLFPKIKGIRHEAEIYGDSVKSFIDTCLTPGFNRQLVKSAELYVAYKAFCKATGFKVMALTKFIAHAKKVDGFGDCYKERKVGKKDGKTVTLCGAHWCNIRFISPALFQFVSDENLMDYSLGYFGGQKIPELICNTAQLSEGNLQNFKND